MFCLHSLSHLCAHDFIGYQVLWITALYKPPVTRLRVLEYSMADVSAVIRPPLSCQRFSELGGTSWSGCSTLVGESSSSSFTAFRPIFWRPTGCAPALRGFSSSTASSEAAVREALARFLLLAASGWSGDLLCRACCQRRFFASPTHWSVRDDNLCMIGNVQATPARPQVSLAWARGDETTIIACRRRVISLV